VYKFIICINFWCISWTGRYKRYNFFNYYVDRVFVEHLPPTPPNTKPLVWCSTMGDFRTLKWRVSGLLLITMGVGNSCLRPQGLWVLLQLIVAARLFYVRHRQNLKLVPGVVCLFSYGFLQATTDWIARVTVIVDHAVMVNSYRREHWDGVPVFPGLVHRYPRFSSASSRFHQERPFG